LKILLLFPNFLQQFFPIQSSFQPPLGLAMIAAMLKQAGHEVHVIDATVERLNIYRLQKRVEAIKPDIIGITASTAYAKKATLTARWLKLKNPNAKIIFGGPWPTVDYEYLLNRGAADAVVIGEGEYTIVDLAKAMEEGLPLADVEGVAFKENGTVMKTERRAYIENLDDLPFPAWELFPPSRKYFAHTLGRRFYPLSTSRGCPMGCIYCSKMVHGTKIRTRSVESIINEIKYLKKEFNVDNLIIVDDNFNYNIERAENICDAIAGLDFKVKMTFNNGVRADKLTPRLAWKMKRAGAGEVALGIESGNQEVVNKIGKSLDLKAVEHAARILKKLNIFAVGFFMVGLPFDSVKTIMDTKRFALKLDLDIANFFRVLPFPGTKLYEMVQEQGSFLIDVREQLNFYSYMAPVFEIEGLSQAVLEKSLKDIARSYYLRLPKILSMVKRAKANDFRWYINGIFIMIHNFLHKTQRERPKLHSSQALH
jgi:radical SAM superfamily enzyme YgiQ (UPF0313 family)